MKYQKLLHSTEKIIWAIFLVVLPVTSFPYLPTELGGKTQVRPLAIYPLLILIFLVAIPRFIKKPLPTTFLPLFAFIAAVLVSSTLSLTLDIEAVKGVTLLPRLLRNLITLGIGVAIYITVVLIHHDWEEMRSSLRWLYFGFAFVLFWGSLQAIYIINYDEFYFFLLNKIQSLISTQELYQTRISGFTYEPKWFGEQITFLLMPWLAASVIAKRSIFKWRFHWITVEMLLLAWSAIVLIFTFSRTGLFILVMLTFVSVLLTRLVRKHPHAVRSMTHRQRWIRVSEAILATLALVVVLIFAGSRNPYFSRLWRYWGDEKAKNKTYLEYIAFGQRFAYAETAFRIYEEYPLFGVGLGNYAFFFNEKLPNRSWQNSPEIIRQLTPTERGSQLITPKNLYARLLAETGLVGTIIFVTFVIAVFGCSLYLLFSPLAETKYWGLAGILGVLVFSVVGFSTDSFAIPNMWVVFGFITAAAHLSAQNIKQKSAAFSPVPGGDPTA